MYRNSLYSEKKLTRDCAGVSVGVRSMVRTSLRQNTGQNLRQVVQRWQSTAAAEIGNSAQVRPHLTAHRQSWILTF